MQSVALIVKATAPGALIVIACTALLSSGNLLFGSVLFSVALCSICSLGLPLFTGAVGYARSLKDYGNLGLMLIGNTIGCAVLGFFVGYSLPDVSSSAKALVESRIFDIHIAFILSFACGILMYVAVYTYRTKNSYIGVLTCVPAFIIAGFEHSIAYMGFTSLARTLTLPLFINIVMFLIGNGAGALALSYIMQAGSKKQAEGS